MFPEKLSDREKYIEEQVFAGNFEAKWVEIKHVIEGIEVKLNVMDDALKVDGVRVNVSATSAQRLADIFDASLPTAMVADMMYVSATRSVNPCPMPISSTVASMIKHSQNVDNLLKGKTEGLASTVGKHWVLDRKIEGTPDKACNYGWHFRGPSFQGITGFPVASSSVTGQSVKVIQPNATAHDRLHSDYSQICQLVSQQCWVGGVEMRFENLLKDDKLARLISHQGPLKIDRQPGVPRLVGNVVLFPITITADSNTPNC